MRGALKYKEWNFHNEQNRAKIAMKAAKTTLKATKERLSMSRQRSSKLFSSDSTFALLSVVSRSRPLLPTKTVFG